MKGGRELALRYLGEESQAEGVARIEAAKSSCLLLCVRWEDIGSVLTDILRIPVFALLEIVRSRRKQKQRDQVGGYCCHLGETSQTRVTEGEMWLDLGWILKANCPSKLGCEKRVVKNDFKAFCLSLHCPCFCLSH